MFYQALKEREGVFFPRTPHCVAIIMNFSTCFLTNKRPPEVYIWPPNFKVNNKDQFYKPLFEIIAIVQGKNINNTVKLSHGKVVSGTVGSYTTLTSLNVTISSGFMELSLRLSSCREIQWKGCGIEPPVWSSDSADTTHFVGRFPLHTIWTLFLKL